ncbi:MAG: cytochrome P460 family protein [bacterium]|nr:cytochrome P460 family protein [bacterium]
MKKTTLSITIGFLFLTLAITQSCKKEKNDVTPEPTPTATQEFIADSTSFLSYTTWTVQSVKTGPSPSLGTAHAGNDSTVTRMVHFKDGQNPVSGKYPVGTIIVKRSTNPANTVSETVAMVKRGNNFNSSIGDWEFFMLMPDGKIAKDAGGQPMRGASLMSGMCGGCHNAASSKDFIFSK